MGRRHEAEGMPNQDSFRYRTIPEQQILVAAVSDGAGSSPKSQVSSSIAVLRAVDVTTEALVNDATMETALRSGFEAAMSAVHRMAARDHCHDISSYHATLVLAAWTPDGIAAIQVGDGAAVVTTPDGPKMLTIPQQGEYANETYFITMPQAPDIVFFNHTEDADGLIIFTDGLQKQAVDFANKRPYPEFVDAAHRRECPRARTNRERYQIQQLVTDQNRRRLHAPQMAIQRASGGEQLRRLHDHRRFEDA